MRPNSRAGSGPCSKPKCGRIISASCKPWPTSKPRRPRRVDLQNIRAVIVQSQSGYQAVNVGVKAFLRDWLIQPCRGLAVEAAEDAELLRCFWGMF